MQFSQTLSDSSLSDLLFEFFFFCFSFFLKRRNMEHSLVGTKCQAEWNLICDVITLTVVFRATHQKLFSPIQWNNSKDYCSCTWSYQKTCLCLNGKWYDYLKRVQPPLLNHLFDGCEVQPFKGINDLYVNILKSSQKHFIRTQISYQ